MSDAKEFWNTKYKIKEMVSALDFTRKAESYLRETPGVCVLDIGCGDGRDSLFFSKKGYKVTSIDFSEEAISRLKKQDSIIDAHVMDIQHMNFKAASFDAVYAHLSLHYFDDVTTKRIISEINSLLKPNGFFFIKCKSIYDPLYGVGQKIGEHMYMNPYQRHFFSSEYMFEVLAEFTIVDLQKTHSSYDNKESQFIEAVAQKM